MKESVKANQMPLEVNVRYVAQGIVTIPLDELPREAWPTMSPAEKWAWVVEWWDFNKDVADTYLKGVERIGPEEVHPGLLEEEVPLTDTDGIPFSEYSNVAQSSEWLAWWNSPVGGIMAEGGKAPEPKEEV